MSKYDFKPENDVLVGRASIEAVTLDETTANRLLGVINRQHARSPLELEQVYLFPGVLSTQAIDYYGTRMSPRSMRNYKADVKAGIALMNMHRTGGWSGSGEQPVGRIFEASLEGEVLEPGKVEFDEQIGLELRVWHYMLRGIRVTEVANDDLILAIDGGTTKDESIGLVTRPDGRYLCSLCGRDYFAWHPDPEQRCPHISFVEYEEGRCFVWIDNAHAVEGSLVYKGATPGAMVRKAQHYAHELPKEALGLLEERYQVRLLETGSVSVPGKETDSTARILPEDDDEINQEREVPMDREQILAALEGQLDEERITALRAIEDDSVFAAECMRAVSAAHAEAVTELQASAAELEARVTELEPAAADGQAYRQTLVDEAVKARVQAQGDGFDAETWRAVLMAQSLDFVQSERQTWQARAAEVLQSGRNFNPPEGEDQRAPAAAYVA